MVNLPKLTTKHFEADARAIVPVSDEIGGLVIYVAGRPAYYVLNGEWLEAVPTPAVPASGSVTPQASRTPTVSTS